MANNFDTVFPLLMQSEGGWTIDDGGPTMRGITLTDYRENVNPTASEADLKNLTLTQTEDFYLKFYWNKMQCPILPSGLDYSVFDFGVNSGFKFAIEELQRLLGVTIDGNIGTETLNAISIQSLPVLIYSYNQKRLLFLKGLNVWTTYGSGWTSRVAGVESESIKLANQTT